MTCLTYLFYIALTIGRKQMSDFDLFGEPVIPEPEQGTLPDSQEMIDTDDVFTAPSGAVNDSYVVVARRYRPQTFAQLVGQEHVQSALSNAIAAGQIGHAYLFSGPRGTGKTSTARSLATPRSVRRM